MMRKLIVSNIMSLDGYYAGPGNDVMVLPMDDAFDAYNAETLLLGRTSYETLTGSLSSSNARPATTSWFWQPYALE